MMTVAVHVHDLCKKCVYPKNFCGMMVISPIPCDQCCTFSSWHCLGNKPQSIFKTRKLTRFPSIVWFPSRFNCSSNLGCRKELFNWPRLSPDREPPGGTSLSRRTPSSNSNDDPRGRGTRCGKNAFAVTSREPTRRRPLAFHTTRSRTNKNLRTDHTIGRKIPRWHR